MTNDSLRWCQLFFVYLRVAIDNLAEFVAVDRFFIQQRFDKFVYQSAVFADNSASFFVALKGNFPDLAIDLNCHVFGILRSRIPALTQKHLIVRTFQSHRPQIRHSIKRYHLPRETANFSEITTGTGVDFSIAINFGLRRPSPQSYFNSV